jgi:hypothetical protein
MTNNNGEQQNGTTIFPTYKTVAEYQTGDPLLTIYFHGLLGLCFDGSRECTVGGNNGALAHQVKVQIKEVDSCEDLSDRLPASFQKMEIEVRHPATDGVWVYAPKTDPDPSDGRYNYIEYGLDMEGSTMHNRHLKKKPEILSPRFYINNGLFYVHQITQSKFVVKPGKEGIPGKEVGLVLAVDIFLNPDNDKAQITFTCDGASTSSLTLPDKEGKRYEMAITNSCGRMGSSEEPAGLTSFRTTDFQMNYWAIDAADVDPGDRFDLLLTEVSSVTDGIKLGICKMEGIVFGDPAPCLPVTFGQSTNLD